MSHPSSQRALVLPTPLGWLYAVSRDGRLIACSFGFRTREEAAAEAAAADVGRPDDLLARLAEDLRCYFAGERVELSRHPVDLSDQPAFYRRAMLAARRIPYGQVRSYGWLAARAGSPGGARAAGQAMAHNPVGLVIPCHRVAASDGRLGGFGGGPAMKRALLELEGVRFAGERMALRRGVGRAVGETEPEGTWTTHAEGQAGQARALGVSFVTVHLPATRRTR